MKVTDDCIRTVEQSRAEIVNDNKSYRAKNNNSQNIANETISSAKNRSNYGTDDYRKDEIENERYELIEARTAIEYIGNTVKRAKHIIDQNSAKPKDYDKWTDNEQYEHIVNNIKTYVPSIPDSLLFFIPAALHRGDYGRNLTKPVWLDMEKFQRGQKFVRDHTLSIAIANILSLFVVFSYTDNIKPLIFNQQSHTPYLAFKRYLSTACRVRNWMMEDPWTVGTRAYNDMQTVRKIHRTVRMKLCERADETIDMSAKIKNPWCPDRETILKDLSSCPYLNKENDNLNVIIEPKGFNQADMAMSLFGSMGMILLYSREFGICASEEDMTAYCHTWRGIAYLLGAEEQYNFCRGSLEEIIQRSRDFLEISVKSKLRKVTPEWEHMLRCFMEGTSYFGNIFSFKMLLIHFTDLLNIDMPRTKSTLTYSERLNLILLRFVLRYAIRLRLVREFINKKINMKIEEAVNYGPEKHKELKKRSQEVLDEGR